MLYLTRHAGVAFIAICTLLVTARTASAGPMPPCIEATLSANGRVLVANQLTYDNPDENHDRHITGSTFRVLRQYVDLNEHLRLNGPDVYWTGAIWSLVFSNRDRQIIGPCPYTLVTDDAEYLVLIGGAFDSRTVLSIYRRRDHPGQPFGGSGPDHGVHVRDIQLSELWAASQLPGNVTDHSPTWYAYGTFAFSPDNHFLIHKTRWGKTFNISLQDGAVRTIP